MTARIQIKTLFGGLDAVPPEADRRVAAESLVAELEDDADDEHHQVAAVFDIWSVTVGSGGMVSLDDMSWLDPGSKQSVVPSLYLRLPSREAGVSLLEMVLLGNMDAVRNMGWVPRDQLPPKSKQVFRQGRGESAESEQPAIDWAR